MKKERVDILLVEQGLFNSREKAQRAIMAGIIYNEYEIIDKPGTKLLVDTKLFVKGEKQKYVSRGGLKLEKAIKTFEIDFNNKIVLDIGASTGGFSDCAIKHQATFVYALDVGTNQLDYSLRSSNIVKVMEKTNFRYVSLELFDSGIPDIATIDVSFISLKHIFPNLRNILKDNGLVIALIKPQFEAGKDQVGKKGIIRDQKIHQQAILNVINYANENQFSCLNLDYSPITGGHGNIEFICLFQLNEHINNKTIDIDAVVKNAHNTFRK